MTSQYTRLQLGSYRIVPGQSFIIPGNIRKGKFHPGGRSHSLEAKARHQDQTDQEQQAAKGITDEAFSFGQTFGTQGLPEDKENSQDNGDPD